MKKLILMIIRFLKSIFLKKESNYNMHTIYEKKQPYYICNKKYYSKRRYTKAPAIMSLILTAIILTSCGSVKKSSSVIEENTTTETDITKFSNSFTLEPVNLDKPILLGKDTIYNTRVIYNNSKEVIKEEKNIDFKEEKKEKQVDYSETIKIVANRFIWLIGILFVLMFVLNWIKNKTTLL